VSAPPPQPPRLVTRALIASFLTVAVILGVVFVLVTFEVRQRVRNSAAENLDAAQRVFAQVESSRAQDILATVSSLAENPTLKAALDTWQTERRAGGVSIGDAVATVQNEVRKIAASVKADVLAVVDARGLVVASAGPKSAAFTPGAAIRVQGAEGDD
jgi:hypothetical protein